MASAVEKLNFKFEKKKKKFCKSYKKLFMLYHRTTEILHSALNKREEKLKLAVSEDRGQKTKAKSNQSRVQF